MMTLPVTIEKMSTEEKLEVMEQLWDDLCQNDNAIESPHWHGEILAERERMIASGEDHFMSLDEAKTQTNL